MSFYDKRNICGQESSPKIFLILRGGSLPPYQFSFVFIIKFSAGFSVNICGGPLDSLVNDEIPHRPPEKYENTDQKMEIQIFVYDQP